MYGIVGIALIVGLIFVLRLLGAWMFRINTVIDLQKEMLAEMKRINSNGKSSFRKNEDND